MNVEDILIPDTYNNDIQWWESSAHLFPQHMQYIQYTCKISMNNSVATKCSRGGVRRADALYSRIFKTTTHKKANYRTKTFRFIFF